MWYCAECYTFTCLLKGLAASIFKAVKVLNLHLPRCLNVCILFRQCIMFKWRATAFTCNVHNLTFPSAMARTINDFSQLDKIVSFMLNNESLNCLDNTIYLLNSFFRAQSTRISNELHRNSSNSRREIEQTCTHVDKWSSLIAYIYR